MRNAILLTLTLACPAMAEGNTDGRSWQAGDHHVHSEWSVDWDRSTTPPTPIPGGDSPYTRTRNAQVALANGLSWMVHTDHGGPGHSRVTREFAWPALEQARREVRGLIQFAGMEFDVPAAEHASLIMPPGPGELNDLIRLERDYSRNEPLDTPRDSEAQMLSAVAAMRHLPTPPLLIVNHPSRTATDMDAWGEVEPRELIAWHDAAPDVVIGMEGAPGHQATTKHRGLYRNAAAPTMGGFDQMTARVGGVWDAILASGRRFWITATSDSHHNLRDGGRDFDPGEYSKTYVWARREADDILDGLREGRMFAATGGVIDALDLRVRPAEAVSPESVGMGQTLSVREGAAVRVEVRVRQPARLANGRAPAPLDHLELILGQSTSSGVPKMQRRSLDAGQWQRDGEWIVGRWELPMPSGGGFVRVRGSSTSEIDPLPDVEGEDPWRDAWFYSNPVFLRPLR